jgi:hypothetical protein
MDSETVEIGAGLSWTEIYTYLVPRGVNTVGGRLLGVAVAGILLGRGKFHATSLEHERSQNLHVRILLEDEPILACGG